MEKEKTKSWKISTKAHKILRHIIKKLKKGYIRVS